jgi:hypothetical protein
MMRFAGSVGATIGAVLLGPSAEVIAGTQDGPAASYRILYGGDGHPQCWGSGLASLSDFMAKT